MGWIIFGLVVGILANVIDPHPARGGILAAIVLGIAGAIVGGFLGSLILGIGISGFNLSSLAIALLGSLFLLFLGRTISHT